MIARASHEEVDGLAARRDASHVILDADLECPRLVVRRVNREYGVAGRGADIRVTTAEPFNPSSPLYPTDPAK
jgi:hypothetical protein